MKRIVAVAALLVALPVASQAQELQFPAFYGGIEAGGNWMRDSTATFVFGNSTAVGAVTTDNPGWAVGGVIGYDFVGPRVELEGMFRRNTSTVGVYSPGGFNFGAATESISAMANVYYDFMAGQTIVPYVGVGVGADFITTYAAGTRNNSTQFAYQGIVGVGYNVNEQFRLNLDGRYHASMAPAVSHPVLGTANYGNSNWTVMLSAHIKFAAEKEAPSPPPAAPAPPAPSSFMVFFDFDRSDLSSQAQVTLTQVANAYKTKGTARVTATGHTDRSGPESYNMALSLRRANSVKDGLVRNGVPANVITVTGRGEAQPLVPTADGVREAQNRRVEIVMQ